MTIRLDPAVAQRGLVDADYLAAAQGLAPNADAQQIITLRHALRPYENRLDLAWAGAAVAQVFLRHPWLRSARLDLWTEAVCDDTGGMFSTHCARFGKVLAMEGAQVPPDLLDDDGAFDPHAAADLLDTGHEDEEFDLCAPFVEGHNGEAVTLDLDRDVLAPLLAGGVVSGLAVARLLWPNHEYIRDLQQAKA